jgi:hypothetical protein
MEPSPFRGIPVSGPRTPGLVHRWPGRRHSSSDDAARAPPWRQDGAGPARGSEAGVRSVAGEERSRRPSPARAKSGMGRPSGTSPADPGRREGAVPRMPRPTVRPGAAPSSPIRSAPRPRHLPLERWPRARLHSPAHSGAASADSCYRGRSRPIRPERAIRACRRQSPVRPAGYPATTLLVLPLAVRHGIKSLPRFLRSGESHELGDRLGITGDDDLALRAQEGFRLGPALAKVSHGERLHERSITCFTRRISRLEQGRRFDQRDPRASCAPRACGDRNAGPGRRAR